MSMAKENAAEGLPDVDNHRIDRVCLRFEDAWQTGNAPNIEEFVVEWRGLERSILLRELLLLEVHYLRQGGVEPSAETYFARFPQDREVVSDVFGLRPEVAAREFATGEKIGRYVVEQKVGNGSFGTVYKAWDSELQRMVALKVPRAERFRDGMDVNLFAEEARTAAQLNHPAIVPLLDVLPGDSGIPILVMPFIEGRSLRDCMLAGRMSISDSMKLLIEIAEAMDYAHRRGFVHRDLEPRNILLDADGRPHITDFGLAIHESTQGEKAGESAGSLAYMSPEQLRGESHWLDGRSDIWAMGVILYELLTGRRPFTGQSFDELASEIFAREPKPPRQMNADIPVALEQISLTCLAKHVGSRYPTAHDLAAALRAVEASLGAAVQVVPQASGAFWKSPSIKRVPAVIQISALLAILMTALAFAPSIGWFVSSQPRAVVEDIEVTVWTANDQFRGKVNRAAESASPIRTDNKIRLSVQLDRPGYLYVLWVGTDGDLTPIFPWPAGSWEMPEEHQPISRIDLPPAATWRVKPGDAGAETVVAIVAGRPIVWHDSIKKLSLASQYGDYGEPLWFEHGQLKSNPRVGRTRSPDVRRPAPVGDAIISNQFEIARQIQSGEHSLYALVIPFDG